MLPTPTLKSILELNLKSRVEPVKPILMIGKYALVSPPKPPGPSLAGKPPCQAWNTVHFGMWEFRRKLHNIGYGEALHRAYAEWFISVNGSLYDKILVESHFNLAPFTAKPDIVYCLNGECGLIEVKGFQRIRLPRRFPN
jgi:hypothetical protein